MENFNYGAAKIMLFRLLNLFLLLLPLSLFAEEMVIVQPDSLLPYRNIYLQTTASVLSNYEMNSEYKEVIKINEPDVAKTKNKIPYDAFQINGFKVSQFTFLKTAGDSLFILATLEKKSSEDVYAKICLSKKNIQQVFVEEKEGPSFKVNRESQAGKNEAKAQSRKNAWKDISSKVLILGLLIGFVVLISYMQK